MTTRLATAADIPLLGGMLARIGQDWGEAAILETTKPPWITVIHETDGKPDGFYCLREDYAATGQATLGPCGGPQQSPETWLRMACEMGIAIEEEVLRRYPKIDPAKCWVMTRMWPQSICTPTPLRDFSEVQFGWLPKTDAGPATGKEGYTEKVGGPRTYWIKRTNLVAKAKLVLKALG